MSKAKKFYTTPAGIAKFPALNKPETKFAPEGVYKVDLLYPEDELEEGTKLAAFVEQMEAKLEDFIQTKIENGDIKKAKQKTLSRKPILGDDEDKEGESTGQVYLRAKMKARVEPKGKEPFEQKPDIFDTVNKKPIEHPPQIWGGSRLQLSLEPIPYYSPKDNEAGISFRLRAVRILELVTSGSRGADGYGFDDDVDGDYEAPEDAAPFDKDDDDDGDSSDAPAGKNPDF